MRISTRLKLAGLLSAGVVVAIGILLLFATQQLQKELARNETAAEVLNAATSIRYLTLEYVLHHEKRAQVQWQLRQASFLRLLTSTAASAEAEERTTLDELRHLHNNVDAVFNQLVSNQQERQIDGQKNQVLEELDSRLTGQIANKTQAMIAGALSLSEHSRSRVLKAQQQANVAIVAFGGVALAIIAATIFLILRSVTRPLEMLRKGTTIVGAGDLDYKLGVTTHDEIGDLARAFDAMTATLKGTTVSRDELVQSNELLQSEIIEREHTEAALRESQERNIAVVNTALDGIISINHEGRIIDFNAAAERIFGHRTCDVLGSDMANLLIPHSLREQHRHGLTRYLTDGEGPILGQRIELTALRADGLEFPVELSITRSG